MSNAELWLFQLESLLESVPFNLVRFFWQTSLLIAAVWFINRTVFRESSVIKSKIWTCIFCFIPLFLLISGIFETNKSFEVRIPIDSVFLSGQSGFENSLSEIKTVQTPYQKSVYDKPTGEIIMLLIKHKSALTLVIYFFGFAIMFFAFIVNNIRVFRWKGKGRLMSDRRITGNVVRLKKQFGINAEINVIQSEKIPIPMVYGIFTPSILIPSHMLEKYDDESLKVVLAHECAHIARKDNLVLLYASLVRMVLFFHPLVWFAVNRLAVSLEEASDIAVIGMTDITVDNYAEVLFGMAATSFISLSTVPFFRNHNILDRISAILKTSGTQKGGIVMNRFKKYALLTIAGVVIVFSMIVNFTCTRHQGSESNLSDDIYMTVYGKVVDPDGNPVAGIPVDAVREIPVIYSFGNSLTGDCRFMAKTDSDGNFSISFPKKVNQGIKTSFPKLVRQKVSRDGGIVLIAHAGNTTTYMSEHQWLPDLANGISQPIKLIKSNVGPVEITLTKGVSISGTVYDGNNRPEQGREVYIAYRDGHYNRYYRPTTITDADGHFTLTNVRPGKAWVMTRTELIKSSDMTYPVKAVAEVDIEKNKSFNGLTLRLENIEKWVGDKADKSERIKYSAW